MVEAIPRWETTAPHPLVQWYGNVHLLSTRVLGQWCCFDRGSGRLLWDVRLGRPNTICAVAEEVIVASETRSDGPWTADFGCYGISLESGVLLWDSHGRGWWGRFLRLLDRVPDFTNDLRDTPHHVSGGEVFCHSGRVLDIRTGLDLRRVSREEVRQHEEPKSDGWCLYSGMAVRIGEDAWLSHREDRPNHTNGTSQERVPTTFDWKMDRAQFYLLRDDGSVQWRFRLDTDRVHLGGNYYSYRYAYPYVYLVVSEHWQSRGDPAHAGASSGGPARYRLIALSVTHGTVVGDILLDQRELTQCRIEAIDGGGVLLSLDACRLRYYQRVPLTPS